MAATLGRLLLLALVARASAARGATLHPNQTDDAIYVGTDCGRDAPNLGHCTLSAAIGFAQPGDTVSLEPPSPPGPYTLTLGELLINKDITIRGAGARTTTVTAAGCPAPCRVFHIDQATVTLAGMTITGGNATGPCGGIGPCPQGGGIFVRGSSVGTRNADLTVTDCTVRDNITTGTGIPSGGAGIDVAAGTLTVINSTITGNHSTNGSGGGIEASFATVTITNSTVTGNVAGDSPSVGLGGAIVSQDTAFTVRSSTISGNTANGAGPDPRGGNIFGFAGTTYDFEDSIVAGGIAAAGVNCTVLSGPTDPSSITSNGHNIDSADECGFHAAGDYSNTDPQLGPLADNGGQTDTQAPAPGSVTIDGGSRDCPPPSTDQRGIARPQPAGGACDIGAVEVVPLPTTTTTLPAPAEICGDCVDNDGNGLTDLEDPACCPPGSGATLTLGPSRLAPHRGSAKLKLTGTLAPLTLRAGAAQDLFIQLRTDGGPDFLCARIPAADVVHRGAKEIFEGAKQGVETAQGIDAVVIKPMKKGGMALKVRGTKVPLRLPPAGTVDVTVGLRDPAAAEAGNLCATEGVPFTRSKKGALKYP
jgi:hypothetical protein